MTFDEIKKLISLVNETDIAELCVETDGVKLSLKKGAAFAKESAAAPGAAVAAPLPPERDTALEAAAGAGAKSGSVDGTTVTAPMVGTFYRAPSPDASPYVSVGDAIDVGQPLCIIEAMKLMNEIESEVKGRIAQILVENGQPVEYGQPLFVVEPA